jgi:hypothetical protein
VNDAAGIRDRRIGESTGKGRPGNGANSADKHARLKRRPQKMPTVT